MRVGILTFHETNNFGSLLQTYALFKVLHDKKIDCDVIDYKCNEIQKREFKYEDIMCRTLKNLIRYILFSSKSKRKHKELLEFLKRNTSLSCPYHREDIVRSNNYYDCFIVGSDIVWGLDVTGNDMSFFLDFVNDNKLKMSYASSANEIAGTEYTDCIIKLLSRFDLIAVREEKIKNELLNYFYDKRVKLVCDPTMLIEPEYWIELAVSSQYSDRLQGRDYILMYFPDGEGKMLHDARKLRRKYKCKVYCICDALPLQGVKNIHISKLEDFLCLILNAKLVLSGSYHGTLFSIYFRRNFYYYIRAHGERMNTVSKCLGIEDRQAKFIDANKDVDYSELEHKLDILRTQSYEYVNEMIGKIKEYAQDKYNM